MERLRLFTWLILILVLPFLSSCMMPPRRKIPEFRVLITNTLPIARMNVPVIMRLEDIKKITPDFTFKAFLVSPLEGGRDLPSQAEDTNGDGELDTLVFLIDLEPEARREVAVRYEPKAPMRVTLGYDRRTFAGVFPELGGVAWESEKIAYLLKADYRAMIQFAPKSKEKLSIGRYIRSFHADEPAESILKWFDCGEFGIWNGRRIYKPFNPTDSPQDSLRVLTRVISNGPMHSAVQVIYDNWIIEDERIEVSSTLSIFAGQMHSLNILRVKGGNRLKVAAMIPKRGMIVQDKDNGLLMGWDEKDQLGVAVIFPPEAFVDFLDSPPTTPDTSEKSYAVVLALDAKGRVSYHLMGQKGIGSFKEFESMVKLIAKSIASPPEIKIMPKSRARRRGR